MRASQIQQIVEKLLLLLGVCCSDALPFSSQRRDKHRLLLNWLVGSSQLSEFLLIVGHHQQLFLIPLFTFKCSQSWQIFDTIPYPWHFSVHSIPFTSKNTLFSLLFHSRKGEILLPKKKILRERMLFSDSSLLNIQSIWELRITILHWWEKQNKTEVWKGNDTVENARIQ